MSSSFHCLETGKLGMGMLLRSRLTNRGLPDSNATTIYAFDVVERHGSPFLANRRVFACVVSGIPSSIMCDRHGNVYAGCEDGVQIWNPAGSILGMIEAPGKSSLSGNTS